MPTAASRRLARRSCQTLGLEKNKYMHRTTPVCVFALALLAGCATDPNCPDYSETSPGFYGGDGSSQEQAVETVGLEYTAYRWIAERYPGAKVVMQELVVDPKSKKRYDVLSFTASDGRKSEAWFWISGGLSCLL